MSDIWTEAALEARATCAGGIELYVLELWHADWDSSVFCVANWEDITVMIEAGAPRHASEYVLCVGLPFEVVDDGVSFATTPQVKLRIDNVSGALTSPLELAALSMSPVKAVVRSYLSSDLVTPLQISPCEMTVTMPVVTDKTVEAVLTIPDIMQKNYLTEMMTNDTCPCV